MIQHFSFRVPWHDNGWNGSICKTPCENYSCMRLKGINQGRNEALETENSECKFCDIDCLNDYPCIREGGAFMSDNSFSLTITHPYSSYRETHKHLKPLTEFFPPYSYPARPFKWVMRSRFVSQEKTINYDEFAVEKGFEYNPDIEPEMDNKTWIQNGYNQRNAFEAFFRDASEDKSICIFYAKQVPFIEDSRRVIVGIGHIKKVNEPLFYDTTNPEGMPSCSWENIVSHSIRKDMKDGFLLPYNELMSYASEHPDFDIRTGTVFASDDYFEEFSYASEQISHDAVIDIILQCIKAVEVYRKCDIPGNWSSIIKWLNNEMNNVWEDRGAFPGLGAVLTAFGIQSGSLVERELKAKCSDSKEIWNIVDDVMENPHKYLSDFCADQVNTVISSAWKNLSKERTEYIKLLSRIYLSIDQAKAILSKEAREENGLDFSDQDIIENPYLLYEKTRYKADLFKISIKRIDLALFPSASISAKYPLCTPTVMNSTIDKRRIRALSIYTLENEALEGNTLMPVYNLILAINRLNIMPTCYVTSDIMTVVNDFFVSEIETKKDKSGKDYYKLNRYKEIDRLIQSQVVKRVQSPCRHKIDIDWLERVNEKCNSFKTNPDKKTEDLARQEKAAALKVLAESRLSVLIGGAGTGKTTVLEILCEESSIQNGGVLLLAPTGKARVRMSEGLRDKIEFEAKTIAQFLISCGRYDPDTCAYKVLSPKEKHNLKRTASVPKTVIIDESSMITEDMMGALLDAISSSERIIFVGDYNQLPPIGAGRPFVDIVEYIRSVDKIGIFPVTGGSFAKLTITNRQIPNAADNKTRSDVRLAQWFTDDAENRDEDIFAEIQAGTKDRRIIFRQWHDKEELETLLPKVISYIAEMKNPDDAVGFNRSFGGLFKDGITYFNSYAKAKNGCADKAENWQILAPVRNNYFGILHLNHFVHEKYRQDSIALSESGRVPRKMGADGIVYGDKVINVMNKQRQAFPSNKGDNYVANGEIGIVSGCFGDKKEISIEFATQLGCIYRYSEKKDFTDNATEPLELAYALTVHKSQGSQFKSVVVIINDENFLMSKELLYTALTRQKDELIILYNKEAYNLKRFSSSEYSEIARRFTDIFEAPNITEVNHKFFEEKLIHKTKNGIMVRSKSEVIIANMLCDYGIDDFLYEEPLVLGETYKLPDFTIKDAASGMFVIWEHLGMLGNDKYRADWEAKKKLYGEYGFSEENGNLIVTMDSLNGAIDSEEIQAKIEKNLL